jgi:hypothetical protein
MEEVSSSEGRWMLRILLAPLLTRQYKKTYCISKLFLLKQQIVQNQAYGKRLISIFNPHKDKHFVPCSTKHHYIPFFSASLNASCSSRAVGSNGPEVSILHSTPPHSLNTDLNTDLLHLQIKADVKVNAG